MSEDIYRYYPGIRQVSDDSPLIPGVDVLLEAQASTTSIYGYIRSNSNHRATMGDVRSLIARVKRTGTDLLDTAAAAEKIYLGFQS